jgi:hypothetical protein
VSYRLEMVNEVRHWLHRLRRTDRNTAILVGQAIAALLDEGPNLGRPLVDRIKGRSTTTSRSSGQAPPGQPR